MSLHIGDLSSSPYGSQGCHVCRKEEKNGSICGPHLKLDSALLLTSHWLKASHVVKQKNARKSGKGGFCVSPGIRGNSLGKHLAVSATSNQRLRVSSSLALQDNSEAVEER